MTEVEERRKKTVEASMTEQVHLIMQQHLNGGGRLFGGALMQWLDEVAGVVAMRHAETYRVVTAAVDNLQFKHAIYEGEIVVLKGYVTYVGRTSMEVEIDTYVEQPDGMRHTVNRAFFVMVAVDEDQKPIHHIRFRSFRYRRGCRCLHLLLRCHRVLLSATGCKHARCKNSGKNQITFFHYISSI